MKADNRGRAAILFAFAAVLVLAGLAWWRVPSGGKEQQPDAAPAELRGTGPITLALTGDSLVVNEWPKPGADAGFDAVARILQGASASITNLEQTLLDAGGATLPGLRSPAGGDSGSRVAEGLRRAGFTVVTRANDHGADGGADAVAATTRALDHAGLLYAGAGSDLEHAAAPLVFGDAPRRVAVIAVTCSFADEARATRTRGEIRGRPGVNGLRVLAGVTADAATYAALAEVARATGTGRQSAEGLQFSGRLIKPGSATSAELSADKQDLDDVLNSIAAARTRADVVVVSVHAHEPLDQGLDPAAFLRQFAHQAIERGASLVVGHGARQLRGIETYRGGAVLFGLGSFAFDPSAIRNEGGIPSYDAPAFWESVVATAAYEGTALASIRLEPVGLDERQGIARSLPRPAGEGHAPAILLRMAEMSKPYGTTIQIESGVGIIDGINGGAR